MKVWNVYKCVLWLCNCCEEERTTKTTGDNYHFHFLLAAIASIISNLLYGDYNLK